MSRCYTVVRGDNLSRLARRFGLRGWRAIYDHPWNADFRRQRPDPNLIHPGDVLYIPDPHEATGTRSFNFVRRAVSQQQIDIIEDGDGNRVVGNTEPAAPLVRIGLWDEAYDAAGNLRNGRAEASNFIGRDARRFYFRVRDPSATTSEITIQWRTLRANRTDDDAPASQDLTLTETAAGSRVYVSRAVMLVTSDIDVRQATDSGLPVGHAMAGSRTRGQPNHRLRRARIDGFVRGEYRPTGAAAPLMVTRPIFSRSPEERRRIAVRVIDYGSNSTAAYIRNQFDRANRIWNAVGLQVDAQATTQRAVPAGATNAASQYTGSRDNPQEIAALADLIPVTPDDTVTAVFVDMTGANAYATVAQRNSSALGDRYFIFINNGLSLDDLTLAHELHHVLFNRFDAAVNDAFISFNTTPPTTVANGRSITLPDVRIERRIHEQNHANPNDDPCANNIVNWIRRTRLTRHAALAGTAAADDTTGNTLVRPF